MSQPCPPTERGLYDWEIEQAQRVFAGSLNYARVRIHECTGWPDSVYHMGIKLQRRAPNPKVHNAITVGNHCYFPVQLARELLPPEHGEFYKIGWLMHELTHAWQYQHMGWKYLFRAL
ncbi:MAG: hypothetical protein ACKOC5_06530, partial [Chloroflexota bacterium]